MKRAVRNVCLLFLVTAMLCCPNAVFQGASRALTIWVQAVVPALFPFFITAELILNAGVAQLFSHWVTPLMRPLFNLPGAAAIGVVMGFLSGSPTGATITVKLYQQGLCTKEESQRLLAFTNNAGTLYILSVTAVGIFQQPAVGIWLCLAHYPINLCYGILLGIFSRRHPAIQEQGYQECPRPPLLPLGTLLAQSIRAAIATICQVGGFMVLFAVITSLLQEIGIMPLLSRFFTVVCPCFGLPTTLAESLSLGFFEMTLGIAALGSCAAPLAARMAAAGMILAWNGLCVQTQILGVLAGTDLSPRLYLQGRVIHCILAPLLLQALTSSLPASAISLPIWLPGIWQLWLLSLGILLLLGIGGRLLRRR